MPRCLWPPAPEALARRFPLRRRCRLVAGEGGGREVVRGCSGDLFVEFFCFMRMFVDMFYENV